MNWDYLIDVQVEAGRGLADGHLRLALERDASWLEVQLLLERDASVPEQHDALDCDDGRHGAEVSDRLGLAVQLHRVAICELLEVEIKILQGVVDADGADLGAGDSMQAVDLRS